MKRASENVSEHLLLGFFLISLYHICLLWTNAQERMRLEYCVTTEKKGFLKIFPMVSFF